MPSTTLRVGIVAVILWVLSHAGGLWHPASSLLDSSAVAQVRTGVTAPTLSAAPQAPQAPQLGGTAPGSAAQPLRGIPNQMFGGTARQNAQGTGASRTTESGSLLQGDERFLRRNRRGRAFVGVDAEKVKEFVGAASAATNEQLPPAVGPADLPRAGGSTTVVAKPPRINDPRLAVGFEVPQAAPAKVSETLNRQLKSIPGLNPANQIEVSVAGDVATLRGWVASARDRTLAEQLVLFEPGISVVRNDLQVSPLPPDPQSLPQLSAPRTRAPARGSSAASAAGK